MSRRTPEPEDASASGSTATSSRRRGAAGGTVDVDRAQLVDDRALDAADRVRLELRVPARVVALDRVHQPEQAVRDQIALLHMGRQPTPKASSDVFDERRVGEDQPVAETLIAFLAVLPPKGLGVIRHP